MKACRDRLFTKDSGSKKVYVKGTDNPADRLSRAPASASGATAECDEERPQKRQKRIVITEVKDEAEAHAEREASSL